MQHAKTTDRNKFVLRVEIELLLNIVLIMNGTNKFRPKPLAQFY